MAEIQVKKYYDVIIIGAGISGLTSSALLSKSGLSVCVLEMDARPGGYLAGFDRKEFRFDSAIHWLNNCSPDGWVNKVLNIIGKDFPKAKEQKNIRRFKSDEFNYLVTNNPDRLKEQWIQEFPADKKGIIKFFRDAKRISKSFDKHINLTRSMDTMNLFEKASYGIKMLGFALPFIPHIKYHGDEGIHKGLNKYFSKSKLKTVFASEPDLLSCLIPISWAYSNNFQTPPTGGSQAYPEWLSNASVQMDADIFFKSKVDKITTKKGKVSGVRFQNSGNSHQINSKYIVAACDAETLFEKLLEKDAIPEKQKLALSKAQLYSSAFTVSIGLNCTPEELGLGEENIYLYDSNISRKELGGGDPKKSGIHVMASSVRDKSLAPLNKGTITLFIPAWIDKNNNWACEIDENGNYLRGEKYKQLKDKYANILIDRIQDKLIPNFREHIVLYDAATPITHLRYTGNKNGSMMGQRPGKENMQAKVASYQTPVKNLLLSGHWADLGGGIPIAMKSAVNTSLMILQKEKPKIFRLLADYIDGKINIKKIDSSGLLKDYDNSWVQALTPAQKLK